MSNHEPYRERIVYPKGYGAANFPEPMPSMDEIERRVYLQEQERIQQELTRLRKMLEQEQQKEQSKQ